MSCLKVENVRNCLKTSKACLKSKCGVSSQCLRSAPAGGEFPEQTASHRGFPIPHMFKPKSLKFLPSVQHFWVWLTTLRLYFQTALISKGFSAMQTPVSTRSPGRTAAKLNLAFGNEFIHLICMQLGQTNPNFKGKWVLIFLKRVNIEQPDPWEAA